MDEFNNDKNPFDEQQPSGGQQQNVNPYAQQGSDPYNQPNPNSYNQQSQQNANPYNQMLQNANPYQQQKPQNFNPYLQQGGWQGIEQSRISAAQQSTGMAIASLVLGIVSIVLGIPMLLLPFLFLIPVIGLVLGIVYKTKHLPVGKGLSTAGIITSSLGLVLPIVLLVAVVIFMMSNPDFMRQYMNQLREVSPEQYQEFYDQLGGQFPEWFESVLYFILK